MIRAQDNKRLIEVEEREVIFLRQLMREHVEFYSGLAGSEKASETTRNKYAFLKVLYEKLF